MARHVENVVAGGHGAGVQARSRAGSTWVLLVVEVLMFGHGAKGGARASASAAPGVSGNCPAVAQEGLREHR